MSKTKKIDPKRFFFGLNDQAKKQSETDRLCAYLKSFPSDRYCRIVVTEGKEKRSEEQNALWWVWNQELVSEHDGSHDADYYHAHNKLYVLLPLMLHSFERWREEAEIIDAAISSQPHEAMQLWTAYKIVESSGLHVSEGKLYTEKLQEYWLERGVTLEIKASTKKYKNYRQAA